MIKWQPVIGFENKYLVSNTGKVWSIVRQRELKPSVDKYGYLKVVLCSNGIRCYKTVHRLVAEAFVPNPNNLKTVNHINEDKTDNDCTNLEWLSVADNDNHGTRNERMSKSKCHQPVEQILTDGSTVKYIGVKDASLKTGINRCGISLCCKKVRKTAGGYEWRYANG